MPNFQRIENKKGKLLDVILKFGAWKDWRVSEMIEDPEGQNYIRNFILGEDSNFPETFQNTILKVLKRCKVDLDDGDISFEYNDL